MRNNNLAHCCAKTATIKQGTENFGEDIFVDHNNWSDECYLTTSRINLNLPVVVFISLLIISYVVSGSVSECYERSKQSVENESVSSCQLY